MANILFLHCLDRSLLRQIFTEALKMRKGGFTAAENGEWWAVDYQSPLFLKAPWPFFPPWFSHWLSFLVGLLSGLLPSRLALSNKQWGLCDQSPNFSQFSSLLFSSYLLRWERPHLYKKGLIRICSQNKMLSPLRLMIPPLCQAKVMGSQCSVGHLRGSVS